MTFYNIGYLTSDLEYSAQILNIQHRRLHLQLLMQDDLAGFETGAGTGQVFPAIFHSVTTAESQY